MASVLGEQSVDSKEIARCIKKRHLMCAQRLYSILSPHDSTSSEVDFSLLEEAAPAGSMVGGPVSFVCVSASSSLDVHFWLFLVGLCLDQKLDVLSFWLLQFVLATWHLELLVPIIGCLVHVIRSRLWLPLQLCSLKMMSALTPHGTHNACWMRVLCGQSGVRSRAPRFGPHAGVRLAASASE